MMEKDVFDNYGEIKINFQNGGYLVAPVDQEESACGSCSGC